MLVNRIKLADVLGCSLPTVDKYLAEGAPYIDRPGVAGKTQWNIETGDVIQWLIDRASGKDETKESVRDSAETRERVAIAGLKELELGLKQKVLIHVDDVNEIVSEQFAVIKSHLVGIPARLAQELAAEDDAGKVRDALRVEINSALEAISSEEIPEDPEESDESEDIADES